MTKRVLLIPDEPNWALDKNAKDLVKYNQSDLILDICYHQDFRRDSARYIKDYDLLFPMYKGIFFSLLKEGIPVDKCVTGIRSFFHWDHGVTVPPGYNARPPRKVIRRLKKAVLVNTHCKKLWYVFSPYLPVIHTKYTCDLERYYPETKPQRDKLVVGWAGSLTNHKGKRGFFEFIKPACEAVPGIELKVQNKDDCFITSDAKMREFYTSLDLYISASRCEGTPRPVIEAAACGVPVLSTDVGIVPELVENEINGFIVERNVQAFVIVLEAMIKDRDRLKKMGQAIRTKMEIEFNWHHLIWQWTDFLNYALELCKLKEKGYLR